VSVGQHYGTGKKKGGEIKGEGVRNDTQKKCKEEAGSDWGGKMFFQPQVKKKKEKRRGKKNSHGKRELPLIKRFC